ncbi:galectin-7-like [Ursus arctos]|uniref:galectin-7-like n=1 Tax=Ursus arctos TaxID=9644 RepID=UPI0020176D2A|nr:galectin-7-like [Ursus arctos]
MDTTIACSAVPAKAESSNVPHKTSLPRGIPVSTVMRVCGVVRNKAGRFHVNLPWGKGQEAEAALHFSPHLDQSMVAFNTLEQGTWGREEHGSGISFQHEQPFEVFLVATEEWFKAVISDSKYHHFCYQFLPGCVCLLEVGRDLQLEAPEIF